MAVETGTPDETSETTPLKFACSVCSSEHKEAVNAARFARIPLRKLSSQFGLSRAALSRHFRAHLSAALIRAVARVEQPKVEPAEIAVYEDNLLAQMLSVHAVTREELDAARKGPDKRLVVVLLGQLRENIAHLEKMMPARDTTPGVKVTFSFDSPESQRRAEEIARATGQRVAVAPLAADGLDSALPSDLEVSQRHVEPEAHRVEETVATSAKAPVSGPAPADSSPFRMRPPTEVFSPGGRR